MTELLLKKEVYAVVGAAMDVHRELGHGFLEAVYQEALEIELECRGIPFERQKLLPIIYKGRLLKHTYQADVVCFGQVIVELKALNHLSEKDEAQLLHYLIATGLHIGLLINFGSEI